MTLGVTGLELLMPKAALQFAASEIVDEFVGKAGKTVRLMLWEYRMVEKLTPFLSGEGVIPKAALADVLGAGYPYHKSASDLLTQLRERLADLENRVEQYRNLYNTYREMHANLLSRGKSGELNGLSAEDWETLSKMDADQLSQWVKVGRALDRQGRREASQDAVRWVQGNRVAIEGQ